MPTVPCLWCFILFQLQLGAVIFSLLPETNAAQMWAGWVNIHANMVVYLWFVLDFVEEFL